LAGLSTGIAEAKSTEKENNQTSAKTFCFHCLQAKVFTDREFYDDWEKEAKRSSEGPIRLQFLPVLNETKVLT
jgi:hypothetical protein